MDSICGIMRIEKRKRNDVYGLQLEANRTLDQHIEGLDFDRSDIDWTLTSQNIFLKHTDSWGKEITRQLKEAGLKEVSRGKNASVVLLDGLYTASSEWFDIHPKEDWVNYFKECLEFHIMQYCGGDSSKLINAVIHLDESTPHMQVASIPIIDTGESVKLCARDIMGGKQDYRRRQDLFYEQVSRKYGLDRGNVLKEGDLRLHTTKREWQIATQEERLQDVTEQIEYGKRELEEIQKQIDSQPHLLTPEQIEFLTNKENVSRNRKGEIVISEDTFKSLLASVLEVGSITEDRLHLINEKKQLKMDQLRMESQKKEVLEKARLDGIKQGNEDAEDLIKKGKGFDQMKELLKEDSELSMALRKSITPDRAKKYPLLIELIAQFVEWAKEPFDDMRTSFNMRI